MSPRVTRLPGVPAPYPDELLYSVFARSTRYLGIASPRQLGATLLGSRHALAIPDLPSRLRALSAWAQEEWRLSLGEIVLRHTAAPYYTHFRGLRVYEQTVAAMSSANRHVLVRLGICTSVVRDTEWFRLCPDCVREDMARWGETYWRRFHQLPGILVCHKHGTMLHVTAVPFRTPARQNFVSASEFLLSASSQMVVLDGPAMAVAYDLAKRSASLCEQAPPRGSELHDYRPVLRDLGYAGSRGAPQRMQSALHTFVGKDLLRALLRPGADPVAWMAQAAHKPRRALHPLQHLLLQAFLNQFDHDRTAPRSQRSCGAPTRWKSRSPLLREQAAQLAALGYRPNAIARTLGVSWQTAARLIAPLAPLVEPKRPSTASARDIWLNAIAENPDLSRSELRKLAYPTYAKLYRWDRDWLLAHGPVPRKPTRATPRVDWASRDTRISSDIRALAASIRTRQPLVRVSAHRVLGELHARATIAHYGTKLPQSRVALEECCESVDEFQLRRVSGVVQLDPSGVDMPNWKLRRRAQINPDRFPDGGRALLAHGRQMAAGAGR